ncbi:MAG: hypothetical protein ACOX1W_02380 [Catenisphaera adipataccumulans]
MQRKDVRFLQICGLIMIGFEIWKQLFLTYISGHYSWWHFPFQICSLPMYFMAAMPWLNEKHRSIILRYMMTYGMVSGCAGLLGATGLHYTAWQLIAHTYSWHIFQIYLGWRCGHIWMQTIRPSQDFTKATWVYLTCCLIAGVLNAIIYPYHGINLFNMNPAINMDLPVYHLLVPVFGNRIAIFVYLFSCIWFSNWTKNVWTASSNWYLSRQRQQNRETKRDHS